jgi:hypothetical protein
MDERRNATKTLAKTAPLELIGKLRDMQRTVVDALGRVFATESGRYKELYETLLIVSPYVSDLTPSSVLQYLQCDILTVVIRAYKAYKLSSSQDEEVFSCDRELQLIMEELWEVQLDAAQPMAPVHLLRVKIGQVGPALLLELTGDVVSSLTQTFNGAQMVVDNTTEEQARFAQQLDQLPLELAVLAWTSPASSPGEELSVIQDPTAVSENAILSDKIENAVKRANRLHTMSLCGGKFGILAAFKVVSKPIP